MVREDSVALAKELEGRLRYLMDEPTAPDVAEMASRIAVAAARWHANGARREHTRRWNYQSTSVLWGNYHVVLAPALGDESPWGIYVFHNERFYELMTEDM